jgi:hypothetical protein
MAFFTRILIFSCLALTGCAAVTKPMTTPEGGRGYLVECDGGWADWTSCYKAATQACGVISSGRYRIIDRTESSIYTQWGPLIRRNLIVECN